MQAVAGAQQKGRSVGLERNALFRGHIPHALQDQVARLRVQDHRPAERMGRALTCVVVGRCADAAAREHQVAAGERIGQIGRDARAFIADVAGPTQCEAARGQDPVAGDHLRVADARVLGQVAHVAAAEHLPGGGLALAGEDAGEGRLAGSVAPHEAHLVARGDAEGDVLHEEPRAGSDLELLGGDHLGRHPTKGWSQESHRRCTR
jgi:hypothetical protein